MEPFEKLPPHDIEAEEACIGAALVSSEAVDALDFLRPEMFFREKNGCIWAAILDILRGSEARGKDGRGADGHVNQITVAHQLMALDRLEEIGGQTYLAECIRRLPTAVGAEFYGRIVEECWQRRQHISMLTRSLTALYDPTAGTVPEVAGRLIEQLLRTAVDRTRVLTRSIAEILRGDAENPGLVASVDRMLANPGVVQGWPTGWEELDALLGGLKRSKVYTILAATSVGKSWLIHFIAWTLARLGIPCLIATTEMSGDEVAERLLFMETGFDRVPLRKRLPMPWEQEAIHVAESEMTTWPLHIFDLGLPPLDTLVSEVRRQRSQHGICVLLLDHIGHIRVPGLRDERQILTEVTAATKALSRNQDIAVLQVAHVSRDEAKNGWVNIYSGKGSATIEQDSDVVLALNPVFRDARGEPYAPSRREADEFKLTHGYLPEYLSVEKNRDGGQGGLERWLSWNDGGRYVPVGGAM